MVLKYFSWSNLIKTINIATLITCNINYVEKNKKICFQSAQHEVFVGKIKLRFRKVRGTQKKKNVGLCAREKKKQQLCLKNSLIRLLLARCANACYDALSQRQNNDDDERLVVGLHLLKKSTKTRLAVGLRQTCACAFATQTPVLIGSCLFACLKAQLTGEWQFCCRSPLSRRAANCFSCARASDE